MASLHSWVTSTAEQLGEHQLRHLVAARDEDVSAGVDWAAAALPAAYAALDRIASILEDSGKPKVAEYLRNRLPTTKRIRSGDLGEIIGAHFATSELGYTTVARLRWKDHREMAMRGDDIIGVHVPEVGPLEFLKGEAKSRASLSTATVDEADQALRSDSGLPSSHALGFIADRLHEQGNDVLARLIDRAQLEQGITQQQVDQLLFTLTGSNPCNLLRTNTKAYHEPVRRLAVGLQVRGHQAFVAAVYEKAIADA
jgi:Cap4 SAVED domain